MLNERGGSSPPSGTNFQKGELKMKLKLLVFLTNFIASWLDIICGLISVLTLTFYRPWWDFSFRIWSSMILLAYKEKQSTYK